MEIRLGDGTANPYLAYAAALAAGLDGIERELELPGEASGRPLPLSFDEALAALKADRMMISAMGQKLVDTFELLKTAELERFRTWVTDWEFAEYSRRL
jgi:glutamine synthetase